MSAAAAKLSLDALPFELGGASVTVAGRPAPLLHVSPARVDFVLPAGLQAGEAEVIVTSQDGYVSRGTVVVVASAPALFTRDATGVGRGVVIDATGATPDAFDVTAPLNLSADKRARLSLFATGVTSNPALNADATNDVRGPNSATLANFAESVKVEARTADGRVLALRVEYAGAVAAGIDQVTVVLAPELRGAGQVQLTITVGGQRSNAASITIK